MNHPWDYQVVGASGVYTTIEDLAKWNRNFDTERVGGDGFTEQMTTQGRLADGDTIGYAFGLRVGTYRGRKTVEHGGTLDGFRSEYLRFPNDDRAVLVLCNCRADPSARARSVADLVLPGPLPSRADGNENASRSVERSASALQAYTGLYHSADEGYFRFLVEDGRLMAERSRAFTIPLRPVAPRRFTAPGPIDAFGFLESEEDRRQRVEVYRASDTTSFERITPTSYSDTERAAFAGRYHSNELGATYQVRVEGSTLQLVPVNRSPLSLSPGARDEFRLQGGYIRFIRSPDGSVTGFVYNTRRVARLRFHRTR
jgi:hypothetical protein